MDTERLLKYEIINDMNEFEKSFYEKIMCFDQFWRVENARWRSIIINFPIVVIFSPFICYFYYIFPINLLVFYYIFPIYRKILIGRKRPNFRRFCMFNFGRIFSYDEKNLLFSFSLSHEKEHFFLLSFVNFSLSSFYYILFLEFYINIL